MMPSLTGISNANAVNAGQLGGQTSGAFNNNNSILRMMNSLGDTTNAG